MERRGDPVRGSEAPACDCQLLAPVLWAGQAMNLYPSPRTVTKCSGFRGFSSNLCRRT